MVQLRPQDLNREEGRVLALLNEAGPLTEEGIDKNLVSTPTIFPPQQHSALISLQRKGLAVLEEESEEWDVTLAGNHLVEAEFARAFIDSFPEDDRT